MFSQLLLLYMSFVMRNILAGMWMMSSELWKRIIWDSKATGGVLTHLLPSIIKDQTACKIGEPIFLTPQENYLARHGVLGVFHYVSSTLFYKHIFFSSTKRGTLCSYIHVCETSGKLLTIMTNQSHLVYLSLFSSLIGHWFSEIGWIGVL